MTILDAQILQLGFNGSPPFQVYFNTSNTTEEVQETGYLGSGQYLGFTLSENQMALVLTTDDKPTWYNINKESNGTFSLTPASGGASGDTTPGNFAIFKTADGILKDLGYSPSNADKTKVVMANDALVTDNLVCAADTAGTVKDSGIATNRVMTSAFNSPDTEANLVAFDITVTAAALASGASVPLYASSGTKQYKIRALWVNGGGTNFSGGDGDRNLSITDNTTAYSVVPAASLQALANTGWGVTEFPFPAAAAINTSTAAGASLVAKYSGGAADYGAGSVVISGVLQRVA